MILSIILQTLHHAHMWAKSKLSERAAKRRQLKTINKHGFDLKCPCCNRWMNTDQTVVAVKETAEHWHYLCNCGHHSAWFLGAPCPLYDPNYQYDNENPLFVDTRA